MTPQSFHSSNRQAKVAALQKELHLLRKSLDPGYSHFYEDFEKLLQPKTSLAWIDLGCGINAFVGEYGGNFGLSVGCDADLRLIRRAQGQFLIGDIIHPPFQESSFDLATAYMTAEHFENPARAIAEIGKILRPRGLLILCTVNRYYWASLLNRLLPEKIKRRLLKFAFGRKDEDIFPAFYRVNTKGKILKLLKEGGFSRIRIREYAHYYAFSRAFFWVQHFANKYTFLGRTSFLRNYLLVEASRA